MPDGPKSSSENWMDRAKSVELIKWEQNELKQERTKDMEEVDKRLNDLLGAREFVDAYGNQKAKALHNMKMYIDRAYMICAAEAHKADTDSEARKQWSTFLNQCNEDVNQYMLIITQILLEAAKKNVDGPNKGKIDLNTLFDLAERSRELYWQMAKEPRYGEMLKTIMENDHKKKLTDGDFKFLLSKFPQRIPGGASANDSMKLLEASGATTVMYAMNPAQRREFAEYIIQNQPKEQAVGLITSLASSSYLTNAQLEDSSKGEKGLYALMREKGLITSEEELKNMRATIEIGQAKARVIRDNIDKGIHADMDKNLAIKFFEPRYIGGLALMVWRGTNAALSLIAYRNDLAEYLKSPWLVADIAGILAGSALVGNPTILEALRSDPDTKTLEAQSSMLAVWQMMTDKPAMTKKYFIDGMKGHDADKETGLVELITKIREEKERKKLPLSVTIDEMLTVAEKKDPMTKEAMTTKPVPQGLIDDLKKAKDSSVEKRDLELYATAVCSSKVLRSTLTFQQWLEKIERLSGSTK